MLIELAERDLAEVAQILERAGLPNADLREPGRRFYRLDGDRGPVGIAGLEVHGADALLRSVVVLDEHRGSGAGRTLVAEINAEAERLGVERLWLLTTTAAAFFDRLGFTTIDRAIVPPTIQATSEFRELCPASAICMTFDLRRALGR